MARKPRILIAGAGIGGLTAALALLRRGYDVELYEQAPELKEIGAGFQISANGTRVLFELGLGEEATAVASAPAGKEIRLWNTGQTWKLFDLGVESVERYGFPYLMFHRADLHAALVRAVLREKPDAIHLNARCVGASQHGAGVTLHLEGGERVSGDALIGADGVHSRIRQSLFGDDRPFFTGCVAWRGIVPAERLPGHILRPVGTNWVGPGSHIVHYPLRGGRLLNFVGIVERDDWQVESWTEVGRIEDCIADFAGWHDDVQTIIRNIETPYKWALLGREPLERWTVGNVTLLGDACHPTLPFLAQGAVMALEDGYILARCLDSYEGDIGTALSRYEAARHERTSRIVRGSAENAKRFHNNVLSDPVEAERYVSSEWQEERVKQRYDWLFEYDATSVAV